MPKVAFGKARQMELTEMISCYNSGVPNWSLRKG